MKQLVRVVLIWMILILQANANDSIARVGAGGITFTKSENIRMLQEVLEISVGHIKVHYRFINESDNDINATVAFPMPPYTFHNPNAADDSNNSPLRPFSTTVNGKPITVTLDRKATQGSTDVTKELRKIGLSDQQIFDTFIECDDAGDEPNYCGITKQQEAELKRMDLLSWWVDETALWEFVFPPHKVIEVVHEYTPKHGDHLSSTIDSYSIKNTLTEACVDENTLKALKKRTGSEGGHLTDVSYILKTGKNWKGPISDFKLRIIKDSPTQVVSLCFPGKPKRISDSILEFSQKDFVPQKDLVIYFYN